MKVSQLVKILNNVELKYGDIDVFIAPRTYMPRETHRLDLTKQSVYIANKKTKPELQFKLYIQ